MAHDISVDLVRVIADLEKRIESGQLVGDSLAAALREIERCRKQIEVSDLTEGAWA